MQYLRLGIWQLAYGRRHKTIRKTLVPYLVNTSQNSTSHISLSKSDFCLECPGFINLNLKYILSTNKITITKTKTIKKQKASCWIGDLVPHHLCTNMYDIIDTCILQ